MHVASIFWKCYKAWSKAYRFGFVYHLLGSFFSCMPGMAAETYWPGEKRKLGPKENIPGKKHGLLSRCSGCGKIWDLFVIVARTPALQRKAFMLRSLLLKVQWVGMGLGKRKRQDDPTGLNQNRQVEIGLPPLLIPSRSKLWCHSLSWGTCSSQTQESPWIFSPWRSSRSKPEEVCVIQLVLQKNQF